MKVLLKDNYFTGNYAKIGDIDGGIEVKELQSELNESDYKIIKCNEYKLSGLELPYDIEELHTQRQALRDEINKLQESED